MGMIANRDIKQVKNGAYPGLILIEDYCVFRARLLSRRIQFWW